MKSIKGPAEAAAMCSAVAARALVGLSPAAHAAVDRIRALTEHITYDPPLTNTPRAVTFTVQGDLRNCTDPSHPLGHCDESGTAPNATCQSLLAAGSGTRTFKWTPGPFGGLPGDHGPRSEFVYTRTVNRLATGQIQLVATGSIAKGVYEGKQAKSQGVATQTDLETCGTEGISKLTAAGTLTIGI